MIDISLIGHITKDCIITPQQTQYLPGGTAWYFSMGLATLNAVDPHPVSYQLLTAMAESDLAPVDQLRSLGLQVDCLPSPTTLFFENRYGENFNERQQRVLSLAAPFTLDQLQTVSARYIVLGSLLAHDFPLEAFPLLHDKGQLVVDVQGYLREVRNQEVYAIDWADKLRALPYVDVLKVNEYEMKVLTGTDNAREAARRLAGWGVREVLLTFGCYGSLIYEAAADRFHDIEPVAPRQMIDATGCGDTYVLGYVYRRSQGASVAEAGHFASLISSRKIEAYGPL